MHTTKHTQFILHRPLANRSGHAAVNTAQPHAWRRDSEQRGPCPSLARVGPSCSPSCKPSSPRGHGGARACHGQSLTCETGKSSDRALLEEMCHICPGSAPPPTPLFLPWQEVSLHLFPESQSILLYSWVFQPSGQKYTQRKIYREVSLLSPLS